MTSKLTSVAIFCFFGATLTSGQEAVKDSLSYSEMYSGIHGGYRGFVDITISTKDMGHPVIGSPYSQMPQHRSKAIFYSTKSALMKKTDIRIPDALLERASTSSRVAKTIREGNKSILSRLWVFEKKIYILEPNENLNITPAPTERSFKSELRPNAFKVYEFTSPALILGGTGVATLAKNNRFGNITLEVFGDEDLKTIVARGHWGRSQFDLTTFPIGNENRKVFIKVANLGAVNETYQLQVHTVTNFDIFLSMGVDEIIKGQLIEMGVPSRAATHLKTAIVSSLKGEENARMFLKMGVAEQRTLLKKTMGYGDVPDYFLKYLSKYYFGIFKNL